MCPAATATLSGFRMRRTLGGDQSMAHCRQPGSVSDCLTPQASQEFVREKSRTWTMKEAQTGQSRLDPHESCRNTKTLVAYLEANLGSAWPRDVSRDPSTADGQVNRTGFAGGSEP